MPQKSIKSAFAEPLRPTEKFVALTEAVGAVGDPRVLWGCPSKADCARARPPAPVSLFALARERPQANAHTHDCKREARSRSRMSASVRLFAPRTPVRLYDWLVCFACSLRLLVAFADQPRPSQASDAD